MNDQSARIAELEAKLEQYEPTPDSVSFWYMHDGHYFTALQGATLDELAAHADRVRASEDGSYGLLCAAILCKGDKEIRRVKWDDPSPFGIRGGAGKPGNTKDDQRWRDDVASWKAAHEADPQVVALIAAGKVFRRKSKAA